MSHGKDEADQLASPHLIGPHHRAAIGASPLRGVRRSVALGQTVVPLSFKWVTDREDRTPLGPLVEAGREDGALPHSRSSAAEKPVHRMSKASRRGP